MKIEESIEKLIKGYVEILKNRLKNKLISVALFGSVARGKAKFPESDIDLFIVVKGVENLTIGKRIVMFMKFHSDLETSIEFESKYEIPVFQTHIFTPEEIKYHPPIMLDLTTDCIILYDTGTLKKEIEVIKKRLKDLGAKRILLEDGSWYWDLKPDLKWGEIIEI